METVHENYKITGWPKKLVWVTPLDITEKGFFGSSAGKASTCNAISLPGESSWTEDPGGLQSMESQRVGYY